MNKTEDLQTRVQLISDLMSGLRVAIKQGLIEDFCVEKEGMGDMVHITMSNDTQDIKTKSRFADHLYDKYKAVVGYISYPMQKESKEFSIFIRL